MERPEKKPESIRQRGETFEDLKNRFQKEPPVINLNEPMILDYPNDNLPQNTSGKRYVIYGKYGPMSGVDPLADINAQFASLPDRGYLEKILNNPNAKKAWETILDHTKFKDIAEQALGKLEAEGSLSAEQIDFEREELIRRFEEEE